MVVDQQEVLDTFAKYFTEANRVIAHKLWSFDSAGRLNIASFPSIKVKRAYTTLDGDGLPGGILPVRFGWIEGDFNVSASNLSTLEGCPTHVTGFCFVSNNPIENLVGAPKKVDHMFVMEDLPQLQSLEGFPTEVAVCRFTWRHDLPLLRLLQARRLTIGNPGPSHDSPSNRCLAILQKYVGRGEAGAFECGAELATAGFKENARW